MVLLIDNYDSFTWNLAQLLMRLGEEVRDEGGDTREEREQDRATHRDPEERLPGNRQGEEEQDQEYRGGLWRQ